MVRLFRALQAQSDAVPDETLKNAERSSIAAAAVFVLLSLSWIVGLRTVAWLAVILTAGSLFATAGFGRIAWITHVALQTRRRPHH